MTQIEEMREKFEAWAKKHPRFDFELNSGNESKDIYFYQNTQDAYEGFQAAYPPRPEVEVVAKVIGAVFVPSGVRNIEEGMKLTRAAQAAINAIFNQQESK